MKGDRRAAEEVPFDAPSSYVSRPLAEDQEDEEEQRGERLSSSNLDENGDDEDEADEADDDDDEDGDDEDGDDDEAVAYEKRRAALIEAVTRAIEMNAPGAGQWARIVRPPMKKSKHVIVDVCTPQGTLERRIPGKGRLRDVWPGAYRAARKATWGSLWPNWISKKKEKDSRGSPASSGMQENVDESRADDFSVTEAEEIEELSGGSRNVVQHHETISHHRRHDPRPTDGDHNLDNSSASSSSSSLLPSHGRRRHTATATWDDADGANDEQSAELLPNAAPPTPHVPEALRQRRRPSIDWSDQVRPSRRARRRRNLALAYDHVVTQQEADKIKATVGGGGGGGGEGVPRDQINKDTLDPLNLFPRVSKSRGGAALADKFAVAPSAPPKFKIDASAAFKLGGGGGMQSAAQLLSSQSLQALEESELRIRQFQPDMASTALLEAASQRRGEQGSASPSAAPRTQKKAGAARKGR